MNVDRQRKEVLMQLSVLLATGSRPSGNVDRSPSRHIVASVGRPTRQRRSDRSDGGLTMHCLIASIAALLVLLSGGLGNATAQDAPRTASPAPNGASARPLTLTGNRLAEF